MKYSRLRPALAILRAILALEAAALVAIVVWLLIEILTDQPDSFASAIALLVLTAIGALWVVMLAVGAFRMAPWVRGGAITWQVLQIAVAIGCFQGFFARPDLGWALLVPALVVIGLLLWPPLGRAFTPPAPGGVVAPDEAPES